MTTEPDIEEYAHGGSPREWEDESRPVSTDIPTPNLRLRPLFELPKIMAAIDNALRNGSYMTGANLAFEMLCDHLGVERDSLVFRPDWSLTRKRAGKGFPGVAAGSAVPAEGSGHPPLLAGDPVPFTAEQLRAAGIPAGAVVTADAVNRVGRLPWPHGADPVTDEWLRSQGADPDAVRTAAREHIDTLIRRTGGDDRG